jgi:hyperosmotically inducible periplasmic protein
VTFSIEDHRILIAPAQLQQEALSPQVFSIDSDPLPAIRSALVLALPLATAQQLSAGENDSRAAAQIRTKLRNDPDLAQDRIEVRVENRVATLRGIVDSQSERARANELAHVEGITVVKDELRGGRSRGALQAVTDASISSKLKTQFAADDVFTRAHIAVTTTNGVVLLSGTIPSANLHRRALEIARTTSGVRGIRDKLQVGTAGARR